MHGNTGNAGDTGFAGFNWKHPIETLLDKNLHINFFSGKQYSNCVLIMLLENFKYLFNINTADVMPNFFRQENVTCF